MIEELNNARLQFQAALDRYVILCSGVQNCSSLRNILREDSLRHIDEEISLLVSYESKIHEAKRAICEARNYSFDLTLINTLPSETLLYIFQLVTVSRPCGLKYSTRIMFAKPFFRYPDCLAQVCSRWQYIVTSSPALWVHFDLPLCKSFHQLEALVTRVRARAERSGNLPLQVHIAEKETIASGPFPPSYIGNILRPIISRVEDLEFNIGGQLDEFHNSVLREFLSYCTPQKFKKFTIDSSQRHYDQFIGSIHDPTVPGEENPQRIQLSMPSQDIEAAFGHLSTLHLAGFFPKWTSVAYHGLVDLRLTSADSIFWSSIGESDLLHILRLSPALRILYLELEITDRLSDNTPIVPVPLQDLEVLSVKIDNFWTREDEDPPAEPGKLLRLLAPGSRPLRFTFQTIAYANNRSFEELRRFFMRSNIVKFCSQDAYPPLDELLSHARNLQTLVFLQSIRRDDSIDLVASPRPNAPSPLICHWRSWYMQSCEINLEDLSTIVSLYPAGKLVLSNCIVHRNPDGLTAEDRISEEELSTMFPSVKFIGDEEHRNLPNPIANWDMLD